MYHLRSLWWKLYPPPIPSPYLHRPRFARELEEALRELAKWKRQPIEIGCLFGWTTNIIVRNISPFARLKVYDTFQRAEPEQVKTNLREMSEQAILQYMNIWHWLHKPDRFDFLYVDANNTELLIKEVWSATHDQIASGSVVLFEGSTRMRLNLPHKKLVLPDPGLGQLLP